MGLVLFHLGGFANWAGGVWVQHREMNEPVGSGIPGSGELSQTPVPLEGLCWAALPLPCRKVPMFGLEAIWRDGKVVGHIRRADFGFAIDKTIAYGYICDPAGGPVSAAPRDG